MQGQDPIITDPYQRSRRSGIAHEAAILYYSAVSWGDISTALFSAAVLGADVASLSVSADPVNTCGPCDTTCDPAGLNQLFGAYQDLGMMVVSSAGNLNNDPGYGYPASTDCNMSWPSFRPEVIAIGALDTASTLDYRNAPIAEMSGRGWMEVGVGGFLGGFGYVGQVAPVSYTTVGSAKLYFTEDSTYQDTSSDTYFSVVRAGTSISTPIFAGGAALFRQAHPLHAFFGVGYLRALMSAMSYRDGDREVYGVGKARFRDVLALTPPANWYSPAFDIEEGEGIEFMFPGAENGSGAVTFKLAAYVDARDLTQVPLISIQVDDTCNDATMAIDFSLSPDKLISLDWFDYPQIDTACIRVRLRGESVAPGGVTVYTSGYFEDAFY
jgi:hypothetical protein